MILSILIPTIPNREGSFNKLYAKLTHQVEELNTTHPTLGQVEILADKDKRFKDGGKSIGKKRNDLVQSAKGKYLCFIDDDDDIAPNYLESIVRLCQSDRDVITFRSLFVCDTYWSVINMDLDADNEQATPTRIVQRSVWHVCPVRSEYAKQFEFPNINNAEDWKWMEQVLTLCKSQKHTDMILHSYRHSTHVTEVDHL